MGEPTSANARGAHKRATVSTIREASSVAWLAAAERHVSASSDVSRGRARALAHATEARADVRRPLRKGPRRDRLASTTRQSWSASRALAFEHTVSDTLSDPRFGQGQRRRAIGALLERAASRPGRPAATPGGRMTTAAAHAQFRRPASSILIAGGRAAPARARGHLLAQLDPGVSSSRASDAALIVSELVTNSVVHAQGRRGPSDPVGAVRARGPLANRGHRPGLCPRASDPPRRSRPARGARTASRAPHVVGLGSRAPGRRHDSRVV
jgi:hypothetical protein